MPKRLFDSEKKMEDWFCKEIKNNNYENFIGRQIPTISGRIDVLSYFTIEKEVPYSLIIYELKNDKIRYKDVAQVLFYKHELLHIILSQYDIDDCIADYVYEEFSWFLEPSLVGTGITNRAEKMIKALRRESIHPLIVKEEKDRFYLERPEIEYLSQSQVKKLPDNIYSKIAEANKVFLEKYLGGIDWRGELKQEIMEEYMK